MTNGESVYIIMVAFCPLVHHHYHGKGRGWLYIELENVFNNEGENKEFDYSFVIDDDDIIASPVSVKGSINNKSGIVTLSAKAEYEISTICALCTSPIKRRFNVPVEHILLSYIGNEEDYDKYIVVEDMRLELDELVREDIFLAMPSRFLCKEDCKGLCSLCGADLNQGNCGCKKPTDVRWDALKELFEGN